MNKKKGARRRTIIINQNWNELFDPKLPVSKDVNPEFVYRVERCTNVMCVAISEMLTPSKVEQLFSKGIDIVVKSKDRLKPLTGEAVMAEATTPEVAEEPKAPPKKPLEWNTEKHKDGAKKYTAIGVETGNVYEIVPGSGGKFNLVVDGIQHNGRGSISHLQKYAQNMEDNLQTAEAKNIPEEGSAEAESAKEPIKMQSSSNATNPPNVAKPAAAPAKPEAKLKPIDDGLSKVPAASPTPSAPASSSPPSTVSSDLGKTRPPARPGQDSPGESVLFNSLRRCVVLFRIADNPANNGDLSATSWVSEITNRGEDSPIITALANDKAISLEGEDTANLYCYLTDKGIEEYKAAKKALSEFKLQLGFALVKDSLANAVPVKIPPPLRGKEVVKKVTQLRYMAVGSTFVFPNEDRPLVGRILRKNGDSEIKVRYYLGGQIKNIQFIAPGTEVWPGGILPDGVELDDLVIGGKKVSSDTAIGTTEEASKPKAATPAAPPAEEKKKVTVKPAADDDEDEEEQEGSFEVETDAGNITVEVQEPKEEGGKQRIRIMGYSVTAIIRWMGSDAWTLKRSRRALKRLGLEVAETTIVSQMASGRNGEDKRGEVPELTSKQEKKLYALIKKPVQKDDDEE